MKFNKKLFLRALSVFVLLDLCLLLAGCGDWESQASGIISLLGPAITAALQILAAFGIGISPAVAEQFNSWGQQAQTALTTVKSLIQQYKAALPADQSGILAKIQAALDALSANLSTLLAEIHVTNVATQTKIVAVFAAISEMLVAIVNLLPVVQGKVEDHHEQARLYVAYHDKAKDFKATFNRAAGAFGKTYEI